ncbi:MAG: endonuclease V [Polyangiaceae bacterium]
MAEAGFIALLDVHYEGEGARAACLLAERWTDAVSSHEWTVEIPHAAPYRPGFFFERELPCLLAALAKATEPINVLVVDGYVDLDESGRPGLGAHLYEHFDERIAVVGVAKRPFAGSDFALRVQRGASQNPLFVTARGIALELAAARVRSMHGEHRIPTLCTSVDHLCRGLAEPIESRTRKAKSVP